VDCTCTGFYDPRLRLLGRSQQHRNIKSGTPSWYATYSTSCSAWPLTANEMESFATPETTRCIRHLAVKIARNTERYVSEGTLNLLLSNPASDNLIAVFLNIQAFFDMMLHRLDYGFQRRWTVLIFMDPCIVLWLSRNTHKMQFVIEFIIPKFIEGSTCFERHTAHHQEL
jgi:hypothetical protein